MKISTQNLIGNLKDILDRLETDSNVDNSKTMVINLIDHVNYCNKISRNRK